MFEINYGFEYLVMKIVQRRKQFSLNENLTSDTDVTSNKNELEA